MGILILPQAHRFLECINTTTGFRRRRRAAQWNEEETKALVAPVVVLVHNGDVSARVRTNDKQISPNTFYAKNLGSSF